MRPSFQYQFGSQKKYEFIQVNTISFWWNVSLFEDLDPLYYCLMQAGVPILELKKKDFYAYSTQSTFFSKYQHNSLKFVTDGKPENI